MKTTQRITGSALLLGTMLLSLIGLTGCDARPAPPRVGLLKGVDELIVSPDDVAEQQAVIACEQAWAVYEIRLIALHTYYLEAGRFHQILWAYRELENMRTARTFEWLGVTIPPASDTPSPVGGPQGTLVERLVEARLAYQQSVERLAAHYELAGQTFQAQVIRNMQARLDPIRTYMYLNSAEFPPLTLRPMDRIRAADELYDRAYGLFRSGKGLTRMALTTSYPKQRQSLRLFRQLVREYPTSDKIALSAYFIGEIYKEYFNENIRSVRWYERAYTWQPTVGEPARFQAATVYDLRLNDKINAIKLYRQAIDHERFNRSNVKFAIKRIPELQAEALEQRGRLQQMGIE